MQSAADNPGVCHGEAVLGRSGSEGRGPTRATALGVARARSWGVMGGCRSPAALAKVSWPWMDRLPQTLEQEGANRRRE